MPLYTIVTPTLNRARYFPTLVKCILNQTVEDWEWIIMDDGDDDTESHLPKDNRIHYIKTEPMTLGKKHNVASVLATSPVVAHFDSDDWHAPYRIEQQLQDVKKTGITGSKSIGMWDEDTHQCWLYASHLEWFLTGGTLCYRKEWGVENPFGDTNYEDDLKMCEAHKDVTTAGAGPDTSLIVSRIHKSNTCPRDLKAGCFFPLQPTDMPEWFQTEGVELLPEKY
jgi:glycosyltransferase involved in cell wall biosynthesis